MPTRLNADMSTKKKQPLRQTLAMLGTLGAIAIAWILVVEIAVIVVAAFLGIVVAAFQGLVTGFLTAIIAYLVINKILWYCDVFDMITAGKKSDREKTP